MSRISLTEPTMFLMLGHPGSGKTFFARQFAEKIGAVVISEERIRAIAGDRAEAQTIVDMFDYILDEFLKLNVPVVIDADLSRQATRRELRNHAARYGYRGFTVWVQTDINTCHDRSTRRDRRRPDDKYARELSSEEFDERARHFSRPNHEKYVVISGKHLFVNQHTVVMKALAKAGINELGAASSRQSRTTPRIQIRKSR